MDTFTRLSKNNAYYDRFAKEVEARSETRDFSRALDLFSKYADSTKTILDIGCGTGNHLQEFKSLGLNALGIEPSKKMREIVDSRGLKSIDGSFENLSTLQLPTIGGIWCAASLLHVPQENLEATFSAINKLLSIGAPFYFTVRLGDGAKWDQYDGGDHNAARFIQLFSEEEILSVLSGLPFKIVEKWVEDSTWGRPSQWISIVAIKN